jgi:hypothetical protein
MHWNMHCTGPAPLRLTVGQISPKKHFSAHLQTLIDMVSSRYGFVGGFCLHMFTPHWAQSFRDFHQNDLHSLYQRHRRLQGMQGKPHATFFSHVPISHSSNALLIVFGVP